MIKVKHSGPSLAGVAARIAQVPTTLIPYAASGALTRCAQYAAKTAVPAAMRSVFDQPVAYTLNSLRIEPASKDNLRARVAVKDTGARVPQENYLLPEVQGGARRMVGLEVGLAHQGLLGAGQYVVPGRAAVLDSNGNVKASEVRTILRALKNVRAASNSRSGSSGRRIRKGGALKNDLFVGTPRGGNRPGGIWRREGQRLRPLFIFIRKTPAYRQRLDFSGVVQEVVRTRFAAEFAALARAQMNKAASA